MSTNSLSQQRMQVFMQNIDYWIDSIFKCIDQCDVRVFIFLNVLLFFSCFLKGE